jgi:hypothetical protein
LVVECTLSGPSIYYQQFGDWIIAAILLVGGPFGCHGVLHERAGLLLVAAEWLCVTGRLWWWKSQIDSTHAPKFAHRRTPSLLLSQSHARLLCVCLFVDDDDDFVHHYKMPSWRIVVMLFCLRGTL